MNAAGLAQQISNNGWSGGFKWLWVRASSGFSDAGDNEGDNKVIVVPGINGHDLSVDKLLCRNEPSAYARYGFDLF